MKEETIWEVYVHEQIRQDFRKKNSKINDIY